jgi:hypothetical protein
VPRRGAQLGGGGGEDGVVAGYPEEQGSCHFRTGREPERRCAAGSGACRMGGWLVSFGSCFDAIWTGLASMVWAVPCCCCGLPSGVTQTKTLLHAQLCSGLTRDRVWPGPLSFLHPPHAVKSVLIDVESCPKEVEDEVNADGGRGAIGDRLMGWCPHN